LIYIFSFFVLFKTYLFSVQLQQYRNLNLDRMPRYPAASCFDIIQHGKNPAQNSNKHKFVAEKKKNENQITFHKRKTKLITTNFLINIHWNIIVLEHKYDFCGHSNDTQSHSKQFIHYSQFLHKISI
jgi:hypothetical protein